MLGIRKNRGDESNDRGKPDARPPKCMTCSAKTVYSAGELLLDRY